MKDDFYKVNKSHHLSSYKVKVPNWHGDEFVRLPFQQWDQGEYQSVSWYRAYNDTKHNRHERFEKANFQHLIDAFSGLAVLIASQFYTYDFSPTQYVTLEGVENGYESSIGNYLMIKFPEDWTRDEQYDFNWESLKDDEDPFDKYPY